MNDKHKSPYQFWLPILGLYTGCRLEELAQLYVEDVKQVEGFLCLDINTEKDKSLKNEASDRMVPLHPVLVDVLDFPAFVESVKAKGQERVFQELKKQSGDYGHYASRWFARFKKSAGIDMTPNKKVFHSFRHNFTDTLFKGMVMETVIEELTGRAGKTETSRRYAKGYNIKDLYQTVSEKLDYPIDLSHLKASKWTR
jgi:integrase